MYNYKEKRLSAMIEFESIYQKELSELDKIIDLNIDLFSSLCNNNEEFIRKNIEFTFLILRSVDYYISAIYLLKQRAFFETLSIIRLSIETSSAAIHLQNNPLEYEKYKAGKFKSTTSISYAKNLIEGFDKFWGILSHTAVHTNILQGARKNNDKYYSCSTPFLNIGNKDLSPDLDMYIILNLNISGNIIYRCFQLLVAKDLSIDDINKISPASRETVEKLNNLFIVLNLFKH